MRKVSKDKYVIAAVLTAGIFLLGLFLGLVIEGQRVAYLKTEADIEKLDYSSMQLQYAFIDQLGQEDNCPAVSKTFEQNIKNLAQARDRIENFDDNAKINKDEFMVLKREYTLAQLRYWLLARKTSEICDAELASILYFYARDELCPRCEEQAFILTYLKKRFKEKLLIFALDSELVEEPIITILRNTYNISVYPTLIIENKKVEGFTETRQILEKICPVYSSEIEDCIGFKPEQEKLNESTVEIIEEE